jgi:hypothetical protein
MPSAYSRTNFSVSENRGFLLYSPSALIFSAETPLVLLTAEPMSIQNGQPTSVATRSCARSFSVASTNRLAPSDCSIWP